MPEYPKSLGAVWKRSKNGNDYLSLSLDCATLKELVGNADGDRVSLVAFANRQKKSDKSPDFWIQPPRPQEDKNW